MKWFYKPTGILAAAAVASAAFAAGDRAPAQSGTGSPPSAATSAAGDVLADVASDVESRPRKLKEIKTLDQVRESYNSTFTNVLLIGRISGNGTDLEISAPNAPRAGGPGAMGGGMGMMMPGMPGMPGMSDMMGSPAPGPREQALSKINDLREKLNAASGADQEQVTEQLRAALAEYFLIDMQLRVKELDEIKARVERMEAKLQKRLDSREEAVDLQLKLFLRDAEGLGFFRSEDSPKDGRRR